MFNIGDRVKVHPNSVEAWAVGTDNIGTITDIGEKNTWFYINWDFVGTATYKEGVNENQYNFSKYDLILTDKPPLTNKDKVIRKIKYLEHKFNTRKEPRKDEEDESIIISWD